LALGGFAGKIDTDGASSILIQAHTRKYTKSKSITYIYSNHLGGYLLQLQEDLRPGRQNNSVWLSLFKG